MAWEIRGLMTVEEYIEWLAYFELKQEKESQHMKKMETENRSKGDKHVERLKTRARKSYGR